MSAYTHTHTLSSTCKTIDEMKERTQKDPSRDPFIEPLVSARERFLSIRSSSTRVSAPTHTHTLQPLENVKKKRNEVEWISIWMAVECFQPSCGPKEISPLLSQKRVLICLVYISRRVNKRNEGERSLMVTSICGGDDDGGGREKETIIKTYPTPLVSTRQEDRYTRCTRCWSPVAMAPAAPASHSYSFGDGLTGEIRRSLMDLFGRSLPTYTRRNRTCLRSIFNSIFFLVQIYLWRVKCETLFLVVQCLLAAILRPAMGHDCGVYTSEWRAGEKGIKMKGTVANNKRPRNEKTAGRREKNKTKKHPNTSRGRVERDIAGRLAFILIPRDVCALPDNVVRASTQTHTHTLSVWEKREWEDW